MPLSFFKNAESSFKNEIENRADISNKKIGVISYWAVCQDWTENDYHLLKNFLNQHDLCIFISDEVMSDDKERTIHIISILEQYNTYYILFSKEKVFDSFNIKSDRVLNLPWFIKSPVSDHDFPIYSTKQYDFNMLLGSNRPHRTILFRALNNNKRIYTSYFGHSKFRHDSDIHLDEIDVLYTLKNQDTSQKLNTMLPVIRNGNSIAISAAIPTAIYKETHFDIVSETKFDNEIFFSTEKTGKPLATGRFFCWLTAYNFQDYLKSFGFDVSDYYCKYDKIRDPVKRLADLIDFIDEITQSKLLVQEIYNTTLESRKHNFNNFKQIRKELNQKLNSWLENIISE